MSDDDDDVRVVTAVFRPVKLDLKPGAETLIGQRLWFQDDGAGVWLFESWVEDEHGFFWAPWEDLSDVEEQPDATYRHFGSREWHACPKDCEGRLTEPRARELPIESNDDAALQKLAGANFATGSWLVLPSGTVLGESEAQAMTAAFEPEGE